MEAASQGAGACGKGPGPWPPPFLQTWTPHPVRTCHPWSLRRGGSSGLSPAFLPDLALNAGRAFRKRLGPVPSLATLSPKTAGGGA